MKIDYLPEDRAIRGQKYCLVSVVGPKFNQKCNMYATKVRGFASTKSEADQMVKNIMKYDDKFDIYVTEVGKFFPLDVDPSQAKNVQHADERLNSLLKSYTENRLDAENQFNTRKQELIEQAIREGKDQEELANRPEHPIAVYSRMNDSENHIKELQAQIKSLEQDHTLAKEKWEQTYTQEERDSALGTLDHKINQEKQELENEHGTEATINSQTETKVIQEITEEFEQNETLGFEEIQKNLEKAIVDNLLEDLKKTDCQLQELDDTLKLNIGENTIKILQEQQETLVTRRKDLVQKLESQNSSVYLNNAFGTTAYDQVMTSGGGVPSPHNSV